MLKKQSQHEILNLTVWVGDERRPLVFSIPCRLSRLTSHYHGTSTRHSNEGLPHCFFLKDRCALPDQMSFVLTLPRGAFVLAVRDRNRANKNKIAVFAFGVATKDFSHDLLLDRDCRRFPIGRSGLKVFFCRERCEIASWARFS